VGLLEPQDQQAKWIGYDAPAAAKEDKSDVLSIDKCSWVWFPEGEPEKSAPIGTRFFRHKVNIADIAAESAVKGKVKRASFRLLADNEATVFVNGREAGKVAGWSPGQVLDITDKLTGGINTLSIAAANEGDNPNPAGLAGKLVIEFEEAKTRAIPIDHSWKTSNSEQENWKSADFNDSSWVYAKETVYVQRSTSNVQRSTFGERWTSQRLFYRRRLICARPFRLKSR
jgi:alpha-L-rhamnosidase